MVDIPKPPARKSRIQAPDKIEVISTNTTETVAYGDLVDMNFKVPPKFRMKAKMQATARGMTGTEQMMKALEHYWASFPIVAEI